MASRIEELVEKKGVSPKDILYHTFRSISPRGKIRVLALKADNIARVEYVCPMCGKEGYAEEPWKRPFSVKCQHCSFRISVPKMKQQFKKEMKAKKK